jgi:DNA-binding transcriptional ArsR family regulator
MSSPEQDQNPTVVRVDSHTLRGLAHPVRVRLLGLLRIDGPSTATKLGERLGLSSAATSYHLRQLATYGFIVDAEDRGAGRERWWRAAHRVTTFDLTPSSDPDSAAEGEAYLRSVVEISAGSVQRYLDERPTLPKEWQGAGTLSDEIVRLTARQADELAKSMWALVETLPRSDAESDVDNDGPEDARRVNVQLQIYPRAQDDAR